MRILDPAPIYYVYIHFRTDDGLPFYVGKGKNKRYKVLKRSRWWNSVVEKHGCTVEFAWKNIPEQESIDWERYLISQFRSDGYPMVNMSDGGDGVSNAEQTNKNKQTIRDFTKDNGRLPGQCNPEEKKMCMHLSCYCSSSHLCFDPIFRAEMESKGYGQNGDPNGNKQKIRDFYKEMGRLPSRCKPEEKKLGDLLQSYCRLTHGCFDPSFRAEMDRIGFGANHVEENKQNIRDFIAKYGRLPSRYKPEEKKLHGLLGNYCSPSSDTYDSIFREEMIAIDYGRRII